MECRPAPKRMALALSWQNNLGLMKLFPRQPCRTRGLCCHPGPPATEESDKGSSAPRPASSWNPLTGPTETNGEAASWRPKNKACFFVVWLHFFGCGFFLFGVLWLLCCLVFVLVWRLFPLLGGGGGGGGLYSVRCWVLACILCCVLLSVFLLLFFLWGGGGGDNFRWRVYGVRICFLRAPNHSCKQKGHTAFG